MIIGFCLIEPTNIPLHFLQRFVQFQNLPFGQQCPWHGVETICKTQYQQT